MADFSLSIAFALFVLSQNPGVSMRRVSSSSFASLAGVSKMPPEGFHAGFDFSNFLFQVFQKHSGSPVRCLNRDKLYHSKGESQSQRGGKPFDIIFPLCYKSITTSYRPHPGEGNPVQFGSGPAAVIPALRKAGS